MLNTKPGGETFSLDSLCNLTVTLSAVVLRSFIDAMSRQSPKMSKNIAVLLNQWRFVFLFAVDLRVSGRVSDSLCFCRVAAASRRQEALDVRGDGTWHSQSGRHRAHQTRHQHLPHPQPVHVSTATSHTYSQVFFALRGRESRFAPSCS